MTNWRVGAKKLFNPYAIELGFDEKDWKVFLNRMEEILLAQKKEMAHLEKQIDRLAKFFLAEIPEEIGVFGQGGAVDNAIHLIKKLRKQKKEMVRGVLIEAKVKGNVYRHGICQVCGADQSAGDERNESHDKGCVIGIIEEKLKKLEGNG